MKARIAALLAFGLMLGLYGAGSAAEHPEHPTSHEHPEKKAEEHPKKEHPKKSKADSKAFQNEFDKMVKDYVKSESQNTGGSFMVHDDKTGQDWKLELVKVHKNKICMLDMGKTCFACADFKEMGGKNKLDLDFYASHSADGKMTMTQVLIHKVNGKPRFTYDKDNNMVPAK